MADEQEPSNSWQTSPSETDAEPSIGVKRTLTLHSDASHGSGSIVPADSVSQQGYHSLASSVNSGIFAFLRRQYTSRTDPNALDDVDEQNEESDEEPDETHLEPRRRGRVYWWRDGRRYSSSAVDEDSEDSSSSDGGNGADRSEEGKARR